MKVSRADAWASIHSNVAEMNRLSRDWTDPENISLFKKLKKVLAALKAGQQKVEAICQTAENEPALHLLVTQAAPRAGEMLVALSKMIDEENQLESTVERKRLFGITRGFARIVGRWARIVTSISAQRR